MYGFAGVLVPAECEIDPICGLGATAVAANSRYSVGR